MADPELIAPPMLRVVSPKPKMTVYYALLIIALLAMLTACLFLYLEIRRFGGFGTVPGRVASIEGPALFFTTESTEFTEKITWFLPPCTLCPPW